MYLFFFFFLISHWVQLVLKLAVLDTDLSFPTNISYLMSSYWYIFLIHKKFMNIWPFPGWGGLLNFSVQCISHFTCLPVAFLSSLVLPFSPVSYTQEGTPASVFNVGIKIQPMISNVVQRMESVDLPFLCYCLHVLFLQRRQLGVYYSQRVFSTQTLSPK